MNKPPRIARWILSVTNRKSNREIVLGDFEEFYDEILAEHGALFSYVWFYIQALKSIPKFLKSTFYWGAVMFNSYIKIAWRNIRKHFFTSATNIIGLALGMACCILMLLWVHDELSFDSFHENGSQIYRVISEIHSNEGVSYNARTPNALSPVLKEDFPEVVNSIKYQAYENWFISANEKTFTNTMFAAVDPEFFDMFSFPFLRGNPKESLADNSSIVITEKMAHKYFGDKDPMGETVTLVNSDFTITGIIQDVPENSHLQFDCAIPVNNIQRFNHQDFSSWEQTFFYTYIMTNKNVQKPDLEAKLYNLLEKYTSKSSIKLTLQPLEDVHLKSTFEGDSDNYNQGNIQYVYIFIITALCILLVACINYMNIATAKSGNRSREVGMRKVIGASRFSIGMQFLGESLLICLFALLLAVSIVYFSLPIFNEYTSKNLTLDFLSNGFFIFSLIIVTIFTGLIAGSYPAFFISSLKPIKVLKGANEWTKGRGWFRKVLVVTQFVFTTVLLIISFTMYDQLDFIRNKNLGFEKDYVVSVLNYFRSVEPEVLRNELLKYPGILNVTFSVPPSTPGIRAKDEYTWSGKSSNDIVLTLTIPVDYEYLNTFKIPLKEGRFFSKERSTDNTNFVINEAAAKAMGLSSPVGTQLTYTNPYYGTINGEVIGVIKDFHQNSLHTPIEPIVVSPATECWCICLRFDPKDVSGSLNYLQSLWDKYVNPDFPMLYSFIDEDINKFYKEEQTVGSAFTIFTSLTMIIACLGLIGLAFFMTEKRTKEISIRKVLGATVSGITVMISKEFIKWVMIANLIACPLAYFLVNKWLEGFAYRVTVEIWTFLLVGIITVVVALLTVIYQSLKAAAANPVDKIRYE